MTVIELHIKQVCLKNYIFPRSLGQTNWLEFYRCFVLSALPRTRPVCPPHPSSANIGPTNHALVTTMSTIHVSNNTKVVWTDLQKTVYQLIWRQNAGNRKCVSGNDLGQSDNDRWRKNIFKRVHVQKKNFVLHRAKLIISAQIVGSNPTMHCELILKWRLPENFYVIEIKNF